MPAGDRPRVQFRTFKALQSLTELGGELGSITSSLIRDARGRVIGVAEIVRDVMERKRAEQAGRFLAEVGDVLASSLDYETTLASVARLAVPRLADWCAVDVLDGSELRRVAVVHADPAKVEFAKQLWAKRVTRAGKALRSC